LKREIMTICRATWTARGAGLLCAGVLAVALSVPARAGESTTNSPASAMPFDLGFIAGRDTTLYGESRLRMLGPLFETRIAPDGSRFDAMRPFFVRSANPGASSYRTDWMWPFATVRQSLNQKSVRMMSTYYTDFNTSDPKSRYRLWMLPFFFTGRDAEGQTYAAVFPVIGQVNEFLSMDRVQFILFPLFCRYNKMDHQTVDVLWPFLSYTRGDDIFGIRVLPLYGRTEKANRWQRDFFLWPLWTYGRDYRPPGGSGYIIFPLFGHTRQGEFQSFTLIPPLIRWSVGPKQKDLSLPWPFFQYGKGKVNRFYIWPFVGAKAEAGLRTSFLFWPIATTWFRDLPDMTDNRFMILPFVQYHSKRMKSPDNTQKRGTVIDRSMKVWPLVSYRENGDVSRTRIPDLWPALNSPVIENAYGPFWTLFTHVKRNGCVEDELLWGLARSVKSETGNRVSVFPLVSWENSGENRLSNSWSLFLGLLGRERRGDDVTVKFMYFFKLRGKAAAGVEGDRQ